jgi:hypothetical protein
MRASVMALGAVIVLAALPTMSEAQSRTTTRGAFGGPVTSDVTVGAIRGSVPPGATIGAVRGALPPGAVVGTVSNSPPTSIGGFHAETPTVFGLPSGQFAPVSQVDFRGAVAPSAVGAFAAPVPPDTVLGQPGPQEIEGRLKSEATFSMWDGNYRQGEVLLNRSIGIREEIASGAVRPEVAGALQDSATFLRGWNRDEAAADMEARARSINKELEPKPEPKRAVRAERF